MEIDKQDYYKVVGLLVLAREHNKAIRDIEKALAGVLQQKADPDLSGDYYGHVSDAASNDISADELLKLLDIGVRDA